MIGSLWQNTAIVNYANAWFRGMTDAPHYRDLPGFNFTKRLKVTSGWDGDELGDDIADLFGALREVGMNRARMIAPPSASNKDATNLAAFAGFQSSSIVFEGASGSWLVLGNPTVLDQKDPERRIWLDHFGIFTYTTKWPELTPGERSRNVLIDTMMDAKAFADDNALENWGDHFGDAVAALSEPSFPRDVEACFPPGYDDIERKQAVYAVSQGWCFGGMGWWNDHSFESPELQEKFDALSNRLWDALLGALIWAVRPPS